MATAILNWVPGGGGGSQLVQYKLATSSTYITFSSVASTVSTESITGLSDNTLYDFRIVDECAAGTPAILVVQNIKITCPVVTVNFTDTQVTVSFTHLGGTIDAYTIQLKNSAGTAVLASVVKSLPFSSPITHTFTGLTANTSYNIRVIPASGSFTRTNCAFVPFETADTPTCVAPTSLTISFS